MVSLNPKDWLRIDEEKEEDETFQSERINSYVKNERDSVLLLNRAFELAISILKTVSYEEKELRDLVRTLGRDTPEKIEVMRAQIALDRLKGDLVKLKLDIDTVRKFLQAQFK